MYIQGTMSTVGKPAAVRRAGKGKDNSGDIVEIQ